MRVLVADGAVGPGLRDRRRGVDDDLARGRRDDVARAVRVQEVERALGQGIGGLRCAHRRPGVPIADAQLDGLDARLVGDAGIDQLALEVLDRVDGLPGRLLVARPVLVARVGQRVPVVAVGRGLDEDGPVACAADLGGATDGIANGEDIHAVDGLGVHVVGREPGRPPGQVGHAHDLVVRVVGHAVVVVLDEVDDRQAVGAVGGEVVRPLRLRRPVERLEHDAVGVRAVAREAAHDLVVLLVAVGHRRAGRDRHGPADDRVGAEVAGREVADVHAPAATAAVALVLAEQLGDHAVDVLLERGLEQVGARRRRRTRHAGPELLVGHRPDRREALGDRVAVTAMGAGDVVVGAQRRAGTDRGGLLADRDVRRPAVVVAGEGIVAAGPEADDHLLHLADREHVVEQVQGLRRRDGARRDLGGERPGEGEAADRSELLLERGHVRSQVAPVRGRRSDQCFRCHDCLRWLAGVPSWSDAAGVMP